MRTSKFTALTAVSLVIAATLFLAKRSNSSNDSLREFISKDLSPNVSILDTKMSGLLKDDELFWVLGHSVQDATSLITDRFRLSDSADRTFVQELLREAFPGRFVPEQTDLIYGRDERFFDTFILTKQHQTNSFVVVLRK